MAWTTPRDWSTGLRVTSAIANQQWRDNQNHLYDASSYRIYSADWNGVITDPNDNTQKTAQNSVNYVNTDGTLITSSSQYDRARMMFITIKEFKPHSTFALSWQSAKTELAREQSGRQITLSGGEASPSLRLIYRVSTLDLPVDRNNLTRNWTQFGIFTSRGGGIGIGTIFMPFHLNTAPGFNWLHVGWYSTKLDLRHNHLEGAFRRGLTNGDFFTHIAGLPSPKPQANTGNRVSL